MPYKGITIALVILTMFVLGEMFYLLRHQTQQVSTNIAPSQAEQVPVNMPPAQPSAVDSGQQVPAER